MQWKINLALSNAEDRGKKFGELATARITSSYANHDKETNLFWTESES